MPTYNHEKYISQAIESALAQETSYSYEILINDDCSTDSTRQIALEYEKKYPNKIRLIYPESNQGLMRSYQRLLGSAIGKYIAILESDDYWTDNKKLQKQIDFLESHPDFGLCVTDYQTVDEYNHVIKAYSKNDDAGRNGNWYGRILFGNFICAGTIVFKRTFYDSACNFGEYLSRGFMTFDYPLLLGISNISKCHYIHENTTSYRILGSSISHNDDYEKNMKFEKSIFDIQNYAIEKYGTGEYSAEEIRRSRIFSLMNKALISRKFSDFVYYAKLYKEKTFKGFVINKFPYLFYFQHILRGIKK